MKEQPNWYTFAVKGPEGFLGPEKKKWTWHRDPRKAWRSDKGAVQSLIVHFIHHEGWRPRGVHFCVKRNPDAHKARTHR